MSTNAVHLPPSKKPTMETEQLSEVKRGKRNFSSKGFVFFLYSYVNFLGWWWWGVLSHDDWDDTQMVDLRGFPVRLFQLKKWKRLYTPEI